MKYLLTAIPQQLLVVAWLLLLPPPPSLVLCSRVVPMRNHHTASGAMMGTTEGQHPPPHCPQQCGNVTIPYPFGIGEGCWWRASFAIDCNRSHSPPRPYYRGHEVVDITLETGEMRVVTTQAAHICYDSRDSVSSMNVEQLNFTPFHIAPEKNEFTGIGCHTVALLGGSDNRAVEDSSYLSGCVTTCKSLKDAAGDGHSCTGRGCCQMPTSSSGLNIVKFGWHRNDTPNPAWNYSRCSYSFVAERGQYRFHRSDLTGNGEMAFHRQFSRRRFTLVLNWAIPNNDVHPCVSKLRSERSNATQGEGYLCKCSKGYNGNPYRDDEYGCTNINECEELGKSACPNSKCIDTEGDYECKCSFGRRLIGRHCQLIVSTRIIVLLGEHMHPPSSSTIRRRPRQEHVSRLRDG